MITDRFKIVCDSARRRHYDLYRECQKYLKGLSSAELASFGDYFTLTIVLNEPIKSLMSKNLYSESNDIKIEYDFNNISDEDARNCIKDVFCYLQFPPYDFFMHRKGSLSVCLGFSYVIGSNIVWYTFNSYAIPFILKADFDDYPFSVPLAGEDLWVADSHSGMERVITKLYWSDYISVNDRSMFPSHEVVEGIYVFTKDKSFNDCLYVGQSSHLFSRIKSHLSPTSEIHCLAGYVRYAKVVYITSPNSFLSSSDFDECRLQVEYELILRYNPSLNKDRILHNLFDLKIKDIF